MWKVRFDSQLCTTIAHALDDDGDDSRDLESEVKSQTIADLIHYNCVDPDPQPARSGEGADAESGKRETGTHRAAQAYHAIQQAQPELKTEPERRP